MCVVEGRTARRVTERWVGHLDPAYKRSPVFTQAEDAVITELIPEYQDEQQPTPDTGKKPGIAALANSCAKILNKGKTGEVAGSLRDGATIRKRVTSLKRWKARSKRKPSAAPAPGKPKKKPKLNQ
jgi:hypothetical protein